MQRTVLVLIVGVALVSCGESRTVSSVKQASHPEVSLPGSNFEIDTDANLKREDDPPSIDWESVVEVRKPDQPTGATDDSLGQGTKEDTEVPVIVDGSIPPNKSDLLTFGVYLETAGSTKFLNLFWHRVQEPVGTTNMDFEFNQSSVLSANGVTPERTSGDLLILYDLSQGGTHPTMWLSKWIDGTEGKTAADCEASNKLPCWGKRDNLTTAGTATGSINTSGIQAAQADGLGDISPRTFGEAQINFSAIVSSDQCVSFGSAYLKSRSSDSFTAALKDFIAPEKVNISNCGSVKVIKKDDTGALLGGASFNLVKDGPVLGVYDDSLVVASCTTPYPPDPAAGTCLFTNILQGPYWVVETAAPPGYDPDPSSPKLVNVAPDATVEITFTNPRQRGAIKVTKLRKHAADGPGDHPHEGVTFTVNGQSKQTDASGVACFDNLFFGTYSVMETTPAGYAGELPKNVTVDNKASCSDSTYVGETVTFHNTPLSDITVSFSPQVPGGTVAKINCGALVPDPADGTPGLFDDTEETYKNLAPATYTCTIVIDP